MVGNDFVLPAAPLHAAMAAPLPAPASAVVLPIIPFQAATTEEFIPVTVAHHGPSAWQRAVDSLHRHSRIAFSVLSLLIVVSGAKVGWAYWSAQAHAKPVRSFHTVSLAADDMTVTIPAAKLQAKILALTSQPVHLKVGANDTKIDPATIQNWLTITPSADKTQDTIKVNPASITKSLTALAQKYAKATVNEVVLTESGNKYMVVAGQDGTVLSDPDSLGREASAVNFSLLSGDGLNFNTPLVTQHYAVVGPEAFGKLIDANVTTKQVYFFENGKLVRQYASSDGKPSTPTVLGEFHIFQKFASQDMKGYNADGSQYFQPQVKWVNYFAPGGYAVHGVYWHPLSWFGNINSSHGCVGLPDDEAEWVYDWAPIGTTVITHA